MINNIRNQAILYSLTSQCQNMLAIYYRGSIGSALMHLYPDIGLSKDRFVAAGGMTFTLLSSFSLPLCFMSI